MKLPKFNLRLFAIIPILLVVIALAIPKQVVLAQNTTNTGQNSSYSQPINTGSVKNASSSAQSASDAKGKVKGFWFIAGAIAVSILLEEVMGPGLIANGVDCVKDFGKCVESSIVLTQNMAYKQTTGCDFSVPNDEGIYPDQCSEENKQAIVSAFQNGDEKIVVPHGGILQIGTDIAYAAFEVPVPVDSNTYLAKINPFKKAYAQDASTDVASQFSNNSIILKIWQNIRNAAYALLVVALVIIGFMIMTRWKYDSRTSVTIQNSLPRIAVSLLLITFSLAIAGFMADIVRVITSVVLDLVPGPNFSMNAMILLPLAAVVYKGAPFLATVGGTIGLIALLLLALFLIATVIFVFINVVFKIVTRYVTFILLTMFAPLFFLFGALPGGDGIIITWFKRAAAALLVIPAVAFTIKLSFAIGFGPFLLPGPKATLPEIFFLPNPINSVIQWAVLGPIVGLGIFFFATKVPEIVDSLFDIKPMARGGIGPGFVAGVPMAAAGTYGTLSRGVGPALTGAFANKVGLKGGLGGRFTDTMYTAGRFLNPQAPSLKQLKGNKARQAWAPISETLANAARQKQETLGAQKGAVAGTGASSGPSQTMGKGTGGRFTPDRDALDDEPQGEGGLSPSVRGQLGGYDAGQIARSGGLSGEVFETDTSTPPPSAQRPAKPPGKRNQRST